MKVYNVLEEKGGTSKSTTVQNIAYGLAQRGLKVLVVDLDPQANTTGILLKVSEKLNERNIEEIIHRILLNEAVRQYNTYPHPANLF